MAKKKQKYKVRETDSSMSYEEKANAATAVLRTNGYTEQEIAEIILKSFGAKPDER